MPATLPRPGEGESWPSFGFFFDYSELIKKVDGLSMKIREEASKTWDWDRFIRGGGASDSIDLYRESVWCVPVLG